MNRIPLFRESPVINKKGTLAVAGIDKMVTLINSHVKLMVLKLRHELGQDAEPGQWSIPYR
jgi:hypothetical protein